MIRREVNMYLVIEMQCNGESIANIPFSYKDRLEAESKYHALLSVAAVSTVPIHTVIMLNEEGNLLNHQYYSHPKEGD